MLQLIGLFARCSEIIVSHVSVSLRAPPKREQGYVEKGTTHRNMGNDADSGAIRS